MEKAKLFSVDDALESLQKEVEEAKARVEKMEEDYLRNFPDDVFRRKYKLISAPKYLEDIAFIEVARKLERAFGMSVLDARQLVLVNLTGYIGDCPNPDLGQDAARLLTNRAYQRISRILKVAYVLDLH